MSPPIATINRIGTAVPQHDVHKTFIHYARSLLREQRKEAIFDRMVEKSEIERRWSCQLPAPDNESTTVDGTVFYQRGNFPTSAKRMRVYERNALPLALRAINELGLPPEELRRVTHIVITSCTGFAAPGLDLQIVHHLGLSPSTERTIIGFMGCYAAINGLKLAHHIVRSTPEARVLVVSLELCTLHFKETSDIEQILMFMLFADGAAAALVSADSQGLGLTSFHAEVIPDTADLMSWHIRDQGFDMVLSGDVPKNVYKALRASGTRVLGDRPAGDIAHWAVHPGGRTVLDAVEAAFDLPKTALQPSRAVLRDHGNMSSATVMFVLRRILELAKPGERGTAMSFGPGLTAETLLFEAGA